MTTPGSSHRSLVAIGLATLLATGPLALASHGQSIRGISLFPEPETNGVVPTHQVLPQPEAAYVVGAIGASLVTFPYREALCAGTEGIGFVVGSVFRAVVWIATAGDQIGSGEWFNRTGHAIVEIGCGDTVFITPEDLKQP